MVEYERSAPSLPLCAKRSSESREIKCDEHALTEEKLSKDHGEVGETLPVAGIPSGISVILPDLCGNGARSAAREFGSKLAQLP